MDWEGKPAWFNRPPYVSNLRIQPGLRHQSRLFTPPEPFKRPPDRFPDAQLRIAKNKSDVHPQLLIFLNDAKNLFSRQLPNMGAGYITRLVFDFNAETVLVLHRGIVTGGICSRLFPIEQFIEVVFLAVDSQFQARGYGRLVMSYLKKSILVYPFYDIIACADNDAVIFFKKQGFNDKAINMNPKRWIGRIKDYEGVTLVHCPIHQDIDYMTFPGVINKQIRFVENMIGPHFIDPPASLKNAYRGFPEAPSFASISLPEMMKMTQDRYEQTPIESDKLDNYEEKMKQQRDKMLTILSELENDPKFGYVFIRPVTEDIAPTYFDTIKNPMDFWTMRKRLIRYPDFYKRPEMFAADITLITDNCKAFNQPGTIYSSAANQLMSRFRQLYFESFPNNPI
ncbi:acetyltransferase, GNAT family protein [Trichomonas vaginalis G3]|uniref:histone acetyltransferase n=1 Tax=Trichomonas vaginalis (strain ATCC PRA-98 / G3) TaxID=412133 RepID=A2EGV5_TRIV3|nr:histone acetyltransferase protein [Trichomonas vaginalis G3]EAY08089.1 acetyltransferase, GNAT family protein [Trichomonas vaginalis G3]KAI5496696.1 histone acetyltransferase protein [Trichomonas vaginalis G3]|eukprot:XP_001320312.1 acetyltransferase, GNAT family protein [Trichomonas vaginalis G3]